MKTLTPGLPSTRSDRQLQTFLIDSSTLAIGFVESAHSRMKPVKQLNITIGIPLYLGTSSNKISSVVQMFMTTSNPSNNLEFTLKN